MLLHGFKYLDYIETCSASLRGMSGMSEGCQEKMSQFWRRNVRRIASIVGSSCAPIDAVLLGSVVCTWNFTISSAGLKEVDLDLLSRITLSLSTVACKVVNLSIGRA